MNNRVQINQAGTGGGGGSGTVMSVAVSMPGIFGVAGSPITTSGTFVITFLNQAGNTFFAGPDGSTGQPAFRAITDNDLQTQHFNSAVMRLVDSLGNEVVNWDQYTLKDNLGSSNVSINWNERTLRVGPTVALSWENGDISFPNITTSSPGTGKLYYDAGTGALFIGL